MKHLSLYLLMLVLSLPAFAKKEEQPQWIAATIPGDIVTEIPQYFYYRKSFKVKKPPRRFLLTMMSLNTYSLWINGIPVIMDGNSKSPDGKLIPDTLWINEYLIKGVNNISIKTRILPEDASKEEGIYLQLYSRDSLNVVSNAAWMCGKNEALKITVIPSYKIQYKATEDVFSGFNGYLYSEKVRAKDKWLPAELLWESPMMNPGCKPAKMVKTERTHRYTGIDMPKFLKEDLQFDWEIDFKSPVYFGFKIESIAHKNISIILDTVEKGLVEVNYETKEGAQEFMIDIPLTLKKANISFPVYMKINSLFFKELHN